MLRTLDALLFYLLQIINKRQEVDRVYETPNELGITNIHEKVHLNIFFRNYLYYQLTIKAQ